jgi:hypothetical protein
VFLEAIDWFSKAFRVFPGYFESKRFENKFLDEKTTIMFLYDNNHVFPTISFWMKKLV